MAPLARFTLLKSLLPNSGSYLYSPCQVRLTGPGAGPGPGQPGQTPGPGHHPGGVAAPGRLVHSLPGMGHRQEGHPGGQQVRDQVEGEEATHLHRFIHLLWVNFKAKWRNQTVGEIFLRTADRLPNKVRGPNNLCWIGSNLMRLVQESSTLVLGVFDGPEDPVDLEDDFLCSKNPFLHYNGNTWNMINFLKLDVNTPHDATQLKYVLSKSILKWFKSKFNEIQYFPVTFPCNQITNPLGVSI